MLRPVPLQRPPRPRHQASTWSPVRVTVGVLALGLFGCVPPNDAGPDRAGESTRPPEILVRNDDGLEVDERGLRMRVEGREQLRCTGLEVEDERGSRRLALRTEFADPRRVVLVSDTDPVHRVRLVGTREGLGWNFVVTDRIRSRATLRRLAIEWVGEGSTPRCDVPWTGGEILDDTRFRTGSVRITTPTGAAVVTADLPRLTRERRLPWFLDVRTESNSSTIALGCRSIEGRTLRDDEVEFGFRIGVAARPSADALFDRELARQWDLTSREPVERSGFPLRDGERIRERVRASRREAVRLYQSPDWLDDKNSDFSVETLCRMASLFADDRSPSPNQDALSLVDTILQLRKPGGLLPDRFDLLRRKESIAPKGETGIDRPRAAHSARCVLALLPVVVSLPDRAPAIEALARELAETLVAAQREDGRIPARFTPDRGRAEGGPSGVGATSAGALLLATLADASPEFRAPALRALQALARRLEDGASFVDRPSLLPGSDPRSTGARIEMRPLAEALEAWARLRAAEQVPTGLGETFARHAARGQRLAAFPFGERPTPGAFPVAVGEAADDGRATVGMARAFLHAASVTARHDWATRGVAAARSTARELQGSFDRWLAADLSAIQRRFGDAWLLRAGPDDDPSGYAQGIDAVWFESTRFEPDRAISSVWSDAGFDEVEIVVEASGATTRTTRPPKLDLGPAAVAILRADDTRVVCATRPIRLPRVVLDLPGELQRGTAWLPGCRIEERYSDGALHVAITGPNGTSERLRLVSDPRSADERLLVAERPAFVPERADSLTVALFVETSMGDRMLDAATVIPLGDWRAIELGDTPSTLATDPVPPRVRFADGRRNARSAGVDRPLECALPIDPDSEAVLVEALVAGSLVVRSGSSEVHRSDGSVTEPRTLRFRLSDRRLWSSGRMNLGFYGAEQCEIARIRWQTEGLTRLRGSDTFAGESGEGASPIGARVQLTVVPFSREAGTQPPSANDLRRAFFGGPDYARTPAPEPRRTIGSAATWIRELSGGRTRLDGSVIDRGVIAAGETLESVVPAVVRQLAAEALPDGTTDLLILVGGPPPRGPRSIRTDSEFFLSEDGSTVVLWLPEREPDGSFLSCGRITSSLLAVLTGTASMEAMSADGALGPLGNGGHLPGAPRIEWLDRVGWADIRRVATTDFRYRSRISIAPLLVGRSAIELRLDPTRGASDTTPLERLVLSLRGGHPADPGGGAPGLWIRHALEPQVAPTLHRLDGRSQILTEWPLSATRPEWAPAIEPPTTEDLFRRISALGADSSPTLLEVDGTLPFELTRWSVSEADQILNAELVSYRSGTEQHTLNKELLDTSTPQVRLGVAPPRSPTGLSRTTIRLRATGEPVDLFVERAGRPELRQRIDRSVTTLEIDQPHGDGEAFALRYADRSGNAIQILGVESVPLGIREAEFAVPEQLRLSSDGVTRAVREIQADESGRFVIRVPLLLGPRPTLACLRLEAPNGTEIHLAGRTTQGDSDRTLIERHVVSQSMTRLLAELPRVAEEGPLFLELRGRSEPGSTVRILDLWLRRTGGA